MRARLILLAIFVAMVPRAFAERLELEAYRTETAGRAVFLVPAEQYRRLLDPPRAPVPPSPTPSPSPKPVGEDHVESVRVAGTVSGSQAQVQMTIDLHLEGRGARNFPLFDRFEGLVMKSSTAPGTIVLGGPEVKTADGKDHAPNDEEDSNVEWTSGWRLITRETGRFTATLEFTLPVVRIGQAWELPMPVPSADRQLFDLKLQAYGGVTVTAREALISSLRASGANTSLTAAGLGGTSVTLRWEPLVRIESTPEIASRPAVAPQPESDWTPELSVRVVSVASVGETHMRARSELAVQVRRNPVRELVLVAGPNANFVDVSGPMVQEWESTTQKGSGLPEARVILKGPVQDRIELSVEQEAQAASRTESGPTPRESPARPAGERFTVSFIPIQVRDAYQEEHSVAIVRPTSVKLDVQEETGWRSFDSMRMPDSLKKLIEGALPAKLLQLDRFPRMQPDQPCPAIALTAEKLEEQQLLPAVIDVTRGDVAITEDGHLVGRMVYTIRNDSQQFLTLTPPAGARPLTIFVAGKAVLSASDDQQRWLIPLGKSGHSSGGAAPFDVSVTYHLALDPLENMHRLSVILPTVDLPVSTLRLVVKLPKDWKARLAGGNLTQDGEPRPVKFTLDASATSQSPTILFDESTLPLRLEVPQLPETYFFSRDLLDKEAEARVVDLVVFRTVPTLTRRAGAFLVGVVILYFLLRRRPEGRARMVAMVFGVIGTAILMGLAAATPNLGLWFYLASGLFMGTVVFGFSRLAVGDLDSSGGTFDRDGP